MQFEGIEVSEHLPDGHDLRQALSRKTRIDEPLRIWVTGWRKLGAFARVFISKQQGPLTQDEFVSRIMQVREEAACKDHSLELTPWLWKAEVLGYVLARKGNPDTSLLDDRIPPEIQPIIHVGFGAGMAEATRFRLEELQERLNRQCHPAFRLFAYEPVGGILAAYSTRIRWIRKIVTRLTGIERPRVRTLLALFPDEAGWLVSHGYGRILYFKCATLRSALWRATREKRLETPAAVQAIAFAYAMVNHRDLETVLEVPLTESSNPLNPCFDRGIIYGLTFWDWFHPGFIDSLEAHGERPARLLQAARMESESNRTAGFPAPFLLRNSTWPATTAWAARA